MVEYKRNVRKMDLFPVKITLRLSQQDFDNLTLINNLKNLNPTRDSLQDLIRQSLYLYLNEELNREQSPFVVGDRGKTW